MPPIFVCSSALTAKQQETRALYWSYTSRIRSFLSASCSSLNRFISSQELFIHFFYVLSIYCHNFMSQLLDELNAPVCFCCGIEIVSLVRRKKPLLATPPVIGHLSVFNKHVFLPAANVTLGPRFVACLQQPSHPNIFLLLASNITWISNPHF